jgi:hypothetical protein
MTRKESLSCGAGRGGEGQFRQIQYSRHYYGFKSHYLVQYVKSYTVEVMEQFSISHVPAETMACQSFVDALAMASRLKELI